MKVSNGVLISPRQIWLVELLEFYALEVQIILFVISAIFMTTWMYRSYSNLGQFQRLKFPEAMAVASWFIPLYAFVGPILLYSEMITGYEELLAKDNYIRRDTRRKAVKNWWWLIWTAATVVTMLSFDNDSSSIFYTTFGTMLFLLANVLLLSSLNDMQMMEKGIGEFKHVSTITASDSELDDII